MKILLMGANNPETLRMINAVKKIDKNIEFVGFLDNNIDKKNSVFCDLPVFGGFEMADNFIKQNNLFFVNLITRDCITRFETSLELYKKGAQFTNFIHPNVNLELVEIGFGNYIQESVILQANVSVGNNSSIHMGSLIGHESIIGNSSFIAHGCNISGLVTIKDGVFVGAGVTILPRITIGKFSTIGAGAVVINDIPDYSVVVGNPGRIIKTTLKIYDDANIL